MLRDARIITVITTSIIGFALLCSWIPLQAQASSNKNAVYFESLQKKLIADGFNSKIIKRLYDRPQVFFEAGGATLLFTYSEAKLDYDQFANESSIRKAKKYMEKHREEFDRTEKNYGVESRFITAILLVETRLGAIMGTRTTLNSLSTLASLMDPNVRGMLWNMIPDSKRSTRKKFEKKAEKRSKWAYKELKAFLKYAYREGFDPAVIPGSFAGAMGLAQFMPSSILAYGKDGNNDGAVDLHSHADSIASIANYLKGHGWRPGISPQEAEKVIYRYNHSKYYVKAILKIAKRLKS